MSTFALIWLGSFGIHTIKNNARRAYSAEEVDAVQLHRPCSLAVLMPLAVPLILTPRLTGRLEDYTCTTGADRRRTHTHANRAMHAHRHTQIHRRLRVGASCVQVLHCHLPLIGSPHAQRTCATDDGQCLCATQDMARSLAW